MPAVVITAVGTCLSGLGVSSARLAAVSKPTNSSTPYSTPKKIPDQPSADDDGLNGLKLFAEPSLTMTTMKNTVTTMIVVSLVGHRRAAPGLRPDLELLVEDLSAPLERHAECGVLVPVPAHRRLHHQPPAAQPVQGGQVLGAGQRMPQRADQRARHQPEPRRRRGHRAEQDQRARPGRRGILVAGQRVVPRVGREPGLVGRRAQHDVLADHDAVDPGPLGLDGEPDQVGHVRGRPHGPVLGQDQQDPRRGVARGVVPRG
jgi:hypothetical protein